MKAGHILPLMAILATMWALILLGSTLIFYLIVPLEVPSLDRVSQGVLKVLLGGGLAILWLLVFIGLRNLYASRLFR